MDKNMWKTWSPHVTATPRQNVFFLFFSQTFRKLKHMIWYWWFVRSPYVMMSSHTHTLQGFGRKRIISSKEAIAKTVWISDVDQGPRDDILCTSCSVWSKKPEADKTKRVIRLKMIPPCFPASQDGPPQDGKKDSSFPYVDCLYQTLGIKHLRPLHEELHQRRWFITSAEWFKAVGMAYFLNGNGS